jgi:general L-amino acid transport system permease protein
VSRGTAISFAIATTEPASRPPPSPRSLPLRIQGALFSSAKDTIITLLLLAVLALALPPVIRWAIIDAVWYAPGGAACRGIAGACWAVVPEKYRVILFGVYPYEEQWRPALAAGLIIAMGLASVVRRLPLKAKLIGWAATCVAALILMSGGAFGLTPTGTDVWGGLPLTLVIFVGTVAGGLPLAVLLALGRRSKLAVVHTLSTAIIEVVRGIPLLAVLFVAALIFPLFIPERFTLDKLLRAEIGMIVFFAAYAAEIIRGGMQAIPVGQYEAAEALGLRYWPRTWKVILPQALSAVVPPLVGDMIRAFKNTSFVSILGLFDMLGATKSALEDPAWVRYAPEAYIFVYLIYFVFCFALSLYGRAVEKRVASRDRR